MNRRALLLGAVATATALGLEFETRGGGELYGRPLRGLTPIPIADLVREPGKYLGRTLAIKGTARAAPKGQLTVEDGGASLMVVPDGTYSLPQDPSGAARAEGRLADGPESGGLKFVASGVELSR